MASSRHLGAAVRLTAPLDDLVRLVLERQDLDESSALRAELGAGVLDGLRGEAGLFCDACVERVRFLLSPPPRGCPASARGLRAGASSSRCLVQELVDGLRRPRRARRRRVIGSVSPGTSTGLDAERLRCSVAVSGCRRRPGCGGRRRPRRQARSSRPQRGMSTQAVIRGCSRGAPRLRRPSSGAVRRSAGTRARPRAIQRRDRVPDRSVAVGSRSPM